MSIYLHFYCMLGKQGRFIWATIHLIIKWKEELERIDGNLHSLYISLSAEKEKREEARKEKRKNRKLHLQNLKANRKIKLLTKNNNPDQADTADQSGRSCFQEPAARYLMGNLLRHLSIILQESNTIKTSKLRNYCLK